MEKSLDANYLTWLKRKQEDMIRSIASRESKLINLKYDHKEQFRPGQLHW